MKKNFAFTLAETLIVIAIIGVVAALTLPNLNSATGDKEKVTRVKKIYASLTDAVDRAQATYGDFDTWFNDLNCNNVDHITCNEKFAKRVTEFMKISKDCGFDEGCFSSAPFLYSNGDEMFSDFLNDYMFDNEYYMVTTPDGMSLAFYRDNIIAVIYVDIDGAQKGKNQMGNDLYYFTIYIDKDNANNEGATINQLYPSYNPRAWTGDLTDFELVTAWVIQNGNLDYLKLDSSGFCPDGNPLNWETKTSCE